MERFTEMNVQTSAIEITGACLDQQTSQKQEDCARNSWN